MEKTYSQLLWFMCFSENLTCVEEIICAKYYKEVKMTRHNLDGQKNPATPFRSFKGPAEV